MNGNGQNANSSMPNKGAKMPKLIKYTEAAVIAAFFVMVCLLKLYYLAYCKTERLRWRLTLTMQKLTDKEK